MPGLTLQDWLAATHPDTDVDELVVLEERPGTRAVVEGSIRETVKDHLAGLDVVRRIGGYKKALAYVRNKLPTSKAVRSGDFGEILATEYIDQCTAYRVPIKRLRWKDDRNVAMRGDDVIAIRRQGQRWRLLKAEAKSRARLDTGVVAEAVAGLERHVGRPNPCSLAFISSRLRELGRDDEAAVFEDLQSRTPRQSDVEHLVFTLSGNDPTGVLKAHRGRPAAAVRRNLVGCVIPDHQQLINSTFDGIHGGNRRSNRRAR